MKDWRNGPGRAIDIKTSRRPVTPVDAWRQVREWLACETAWIPLPGSGHTELLETYLTHAS